MWVHSDCPLYSDDRLAFTDAVDDLVLHNDPFGWQAMSWDQRYQFLLSDGPAEGTPITALQQWCRIQVHLYWFLAQAYKTRDAYVRDC